MTYKSKALSLMFEGPEQHEALVKLFDAFVNQYVFLQYHKGDFETQFRKWWMWYGPTGFHKHEDCVKFKSRFKAYLKAKLEAAKEEEDGTTEDSSQS